MKSSPVMRVKLMASFGGILVMTLEARLQVVRGVSRIRWKMASGTWTSWHEERSEKGEGQLVRRMIRRGALERENQP